LEGYTESNNKIFQCLKAFEDIWRDYLDFCDACIKTLKNEEDAANQIVRSLYFSAKWVEYQKDIEEAASAIDEVCDIIPINATGAPRLPPTQPPQGWGSFGFNTQLGWPSPARLFKSATTNSQIHQPDTNVNNGLKTFSAVFIGFGFLVIITRDNKASRFLRMSGKEAYSAIKSLL
jgi:hypothetical protein